MQKQNLMKKKRSANTARALAVVRFGHRRAARPPQTNTQTDRTDYNTLRSVTNYKIKK